MRVGEVAKGTHPVKAADVHIGSNKNKILLILYTSKTHGFESKPQRIKITAIPRKSYATNAKSMAANRFFCPFDLLRSYMRIRGPYFGEDEPLFIFSDKSPLTPVHVLSVLRDLLTALNLNAKLYSTHSFRGGRSIDMANFGYSVRQIQIAGRWSSSAVYRYLKY